MPRTAVKMRNRCIVSLSGARSVGGLAIARCTGGPYETADFNVYYAISNRLRQAIIPVRCALGFNGPLYNRARQAPFLYFKWTVLAFTVYQMGHVNAPGPRRVHPSGIIRINELLKARDRNPRCRIRGYRVRCGHSACAASRSFPDQKRVAYAERHAE
jgi:hypothetical protein